MNLSPDHRYLQVLAGAGTAQATPYEDPRQQQLHELLGGSTTAASDVAYAYDVYRFPEHRAVMDAFVLSKAARALTSRVLEVPESVIATYEYLFMDRSVFRNRLEVMSYAADYDGSAYGKELVKAGVSVGPEYLLWTFGVTDTDIDTRYVVRRTMIDSFFRGMAHKGNSLTSNVAKESQKWWSTAIRNAEILEKIDPRTTKAAYEELRIALEGKDETLKTDQAPVPVEDILH